MKYLLHSLWAWGFPFFMTVFMFLMDHYQDELPCWVITPKLATTNCFFPKTGKTYSNEHVLNIRSLNCNNKNKQRL